MLENFRKYSTFMIIVVILLAIGLIVTLQNGSGGQKTGDSYIKVENTEINAREYQNQIRSPYQFYQFTGKNFFRKILFYLQAPDIPKLDETAARAEDDIALICLACENEAENLGIYVSTKDATDFIQTELFINTENEFDAENYNFFVDTVLDKQLRMKEADFIKMMRRYLIVDKVASFKTLTSFPTDIIAKGRDISTQHIDAKIFQFDRNKFQGQAQITEKQAKEFYEKNKENPEFATSSFFTKKKIKLTYIPINLASVPITEEQTPSPEIELLKINQERTYKQYKNLLTDDAYNDEITDLASIAKKHNLEVKTTELVDENQLKKHFINFKLKGDLASKGSVYGYLFSENPKSIRRLPVSVVNSHKPSFIHYKIEEVEKPRLKTFEEAKEEITKLAAIEAEIEISKKAAKELQEEISTALKENKDISSIPIDLEKIKVFDIKKFTPASQQAGLRFSNQLFRKAALLPFNSVSELVEDDTNSSFIYVKERIIEKAHNHKELDIQFNQQQSSRLANAGFSEWILHYLATRDVSAPNFPK